MYTDMEKIWKGLFILSKRWKDYSAYFFRQSDVLNYQIESDRKLTLLCFLHKKNYKYKMYDLLIQWFISKFKIIYTLISKVQKKGSTKSFIIFICRKIAHSAENVLSKRIQKTIFICQITILAKARCENFTSRYFQSTSISPPQKSSRNLSLYRKAFVLFYVHNATCVLCVFRNFCTLYGHFSILFFSSIAGQFQRVGIPSKRRRTIK